MSGVSMPWIVGDGEQRRLEFCRLASVDGVSVAALCRRFEISRKTGYKWLARFRAEGETGLVDRSRVPESSPSKTSAEMERLVCSVREMHPAWGGRKIRWVLERQGIDGLPAVSTITDILRRNGLLGPVIARKLVDWKRFEAARPNDMWQMDFKGWFKTKSGRCDPFDVLDDHSRFSLCLEACGDQTRRTVQGLLTDTFTEYGLPKQILCDNGGPWGNTQAGFRWTGLGVWLLDLGVEVIHSAVRHPQTMGKDERFHRTLGVEVVSTRPVWDSLGHVQEAFDDWRPIYNHQRPHEALAGGVPADRYTRSDRVMPTVIEPYEYAAGYETRPVDTAARIAYQGRIYKIGKPFIGRRVGIIPSGIDPLVDVYYRQQRIRTISLQKSHS